MIIDLEFRYSANYQKKKKTKKKSKHKNNRIFKVVIDNIR